MWLNASPDCFFFHHLRTPPALVGCPITTEGHSRGFHLLTLKVHPTHAHTLCCAKLNRDQQPTIYSRTEFKPSFLL